MGTSFEGQRFQVSLHHPWSLWSFKVVGRRFGSVPLRRMCPVGSFWYSLFMYKSCGPLSILFLISFGPYCILK